MYPEDYGYKMRKQVGVAGVLAGIVLCGGLTYFLTHQSPSITDAQRSAAKAIGMSAEDYASIHRLMEVKNVEMNDSDWALTSRIAVSGTQSARSQALLAAAYLPSNSVHKVQAVTLAKQFLSEHHTHGLVAPILVLKKMGDPLWKIVATNLANDSDPGNREFGAKILKKS